MRFPILLSVLSLPAVAQAERWVEVAQGPFAVPTDALVQIRATLEQQITTAVRSRGATPPPWRDYLLQYRGKTVNGTRVVEIHGSCHFDDGNFDFASNFYDEQVMDGGECYFVVYYTIESKRYSKVIFHGYA